MKIFVKRIGEKGESCASSCLQTSTSRIMQCFVHAASLSVQLTMEE